MLLTAFALLQFLDGLTTFLALRKGGYEKNPCIAWFMGKIGVAPTLVAFKALALGIGYFLYAYGEALGSYALALLVALYCVVAVNNIKVLRHLN